MPLPVEFFIYPTAPRVGVRVAAPPKTGPATDFRYIGARGSDPTQALTNLVAKLQADGNVGDRPLPEDATLGQIGEMT